MAEGEAEVELLFPAVDEVEVVEVSPPAFVKLEAVEVFGPVELGEPEVVEDFGPAETAEAEATEDFGTTEPGVVEVFCPAEGNTEVVANFFIAVSACRWTGKAGFLSMVRFRKSLPIVLIIILAI